MIQHAGILYFIIEKMIIQKENAQSKWKRERKIQQLSRELSCALFEMNRFHYSTIPADNILNACVCSTWYLININVCLCAFERNAHVLNLFSFHASTSILSVFKMTSVAAVDVDVTVTISSFFSCYFSFLNRHFNSKCSVGNFY